MGSHLAEDGKILWGKLRPWQALEKDLPLTLTVPSENHPERIDRIETEVIREKRIDIVTPENPLFMFKAYFDKEDVYGQLLNHLENIINDKKEKKPVYSAVVGGGVELGIGNLSKSAEKPATRSTLLIFDYDWRFGNVQNVRDFEDFLKRKRHEIQESTRVEIEDLRDRGAPEDLEFAQALEDWAQDFQFDVVAHSMGGLIARYFLRYGSQPLDVEGPLPQLDWRGEKEIANLILVGTPNLGSTSAFKFLTSGFDDIPLRDYDTAIIGSLPSVYQLLPPPNHLIFKDMQGTVVPIDHFDVNNWERHQWGLLSKSNGHKKSLRKIVPPETKDDELMDAARTYLEWCLQKARRFHEALLAIPERYPKTQIFLYMGTGVPTLDQVVLDNKFRPEWDTDAERTDGDGRVLIPDGRVTHVPIKEGVVLSDGHIELTRNSRFLSDLNRILVRKKEYGATTD